MEDRTHLLKFYVLTYEYEEGEPLTINFWAEDGDHAVEQFENFFENEENPPTLLFPLVQE